MVPKRIHRYLTVDERNNILIAYKNGLTCSQLALAHQVSARAIRDVVNKKSSLRKPCGGRKSSTTPTDDVYIATTLKRNCQKSVRSIQKDLLPNFDLTLIHRRKKKFGIVIRSADIKPFLTPKHRALRVEFARELIDRPITFWRSVFFCDESVVKHSKRALCHIDTTVSRTAHPSQLMGWFAIKHGEPVLWQHVVGMLDSGMYADIILDVFRRRLARGSAGGVTIIQDNARCHVSQKTKELLTTKKLNFIQLPPYSPDLNVIENLFSLLKSEVNKLHDARSLVEKVDFVLHHVITIEFINNLIDSMPKRLDQVIKRKGKHADH